MKIAGFVAIILWSLPGMGQEMHVSQGKGIVVLSAWATKPYQLMSGEEVVPVFAVDCIQKGKKISHLLKFLPGGLLVEDSPDITAKSGEICLHYDDRRHQANNRVGGQRPLDLCLHRKDRRHRLKFIQSLLDSGRFPSSSSPSSTVRQPPASST